MYKGSFHNWSCACETLGTLIGAKSSEAAKPYDPSGAPAKLPSVVASTAQDELFRTHPKATASEALNPKPYTLSTLSPKPEAFTVCTRGLKGSGDGDFKSQAGYGAELLSCVFQGHRDLLGPTA